MSGVEMAGLVLGAIPLLISALEHYNDFFAALERYRKSSSKVRDLIFVLSHEKIIFRAECVLLLSPNITKAEAEKMLEDPGHLLWRDERFNKRMELCFGSLGNAVKEITGSMIAALGRMSLKLKEFDSIGGANTTGHSATDTTLRSSMRARLKFALSSHSSISKDLEALTKLNQRFATLSSQIRQLETLWSPPNNSLEAKSNSSASDLPLLGYTRTAAIDLFDAFYHPCSSNHKHLLRFDLRGVHTQADTAVNDPKVQFSVGYCTFDVISDDSTSPRTSNTGCLTLASENKEHKLTIESTLFLGTASQSKGKSTALPTREKSPAVTSSANQTGQQELSTSLCIQLNDVGTNTAPQKITLRGKGPVKHTVLSDNSSIGSNSTTSLADLLSEVEKRGRRFEIPQYQRLELAESLGTRTLQLHGTPWLAQTLNSDKLYFFGEAGDILKVTSLGTTDFEADTLCTDVELELIPTGLPLEMNESATKTVTSRQSRFGLQSGPPNKWLYHLAILLIELAYQVPFIKLAAELKHDCEAFSIPLSPNPQTAEYQIACQLADNIGSTLGATYAGIVRRCLRCDFGTTHVDLDDKGLQLSVYENVVLPLRELETGFRALQVM